MRKPRKKRKPTFRERQMRLNKKRFNHEMRKRSKKGESKPWYENKFGEVVLSPNIAAMFALLTRKRRAK